jgi:hypothetical protein
VLIAAARGYEQRVSVGRSTDTALLTVLLRTNGLATRSPGFEQTR